MALLLVIALLSATGTLVDSANSITGCDPSKSDSTTCYQYACDQPPCSILCGQSSSFDRCVQNCNGSECNTMVCSSSVQNCQQNCQNGNCTEYKCDATMCFQNCNDGGDCGVMKCTNSNSSTYCEQSSGKELFCDSEVCAQNCNTKKCKMICSSSVKRCTQSCRIGGCTYQCDAEMCPPIECSGGNCMKIVSPTQSTSKPTTKSTIKYITKPATKSTTKPKPSGGTGTHFQVVILLVTGLMLATDGFM